MKKLGIGLVLSPFVLSIGAYGVKYIQNTFFSDFQTEVQISRNFDDSKSTGILNVDHYGDFEYLPHSYVLQEKNGIDNKDLLNDYLGSNGSAFCVNFNNTPYLVTNEHVIEDVDSKKKSKMFISSELDVAFIPFDLVYGLNNISTSNIHCYDLERRILNDGEKLQIQAFGKDFYKISGDYTSNNFNNDGSMILIQNNSLNPFNSTFRDIFFGFSGSKVSDVNDNLVGMVKTISSNSLNPNILELKFIPVTEIYDFAQENIK